MSNQLCISYQLGSISLQVSAQWPDLTWIIFVQKYLLIAPEQPSLHLVKVQKSNGVVTSDGETVSFLRWWEILKDATAKVALIITFFDPSMNTNNGPKP